MTATPARSLRRWPGRLVAFAALALLPLAVRGQSPASQPAAPAGPATSRPDNAPLNPTLLKMADNSWLNLKPAGVAAYARMYSGCCFGGGELWYFGGAHRGYKGNDVQLYNPRTNAWRQATEPEWPAIDSDDWKSMTNGGGSTKNLSPTGRPFTEHTYQQVCWQPERKRFFVALVSSGVWEFDPASNQWIHLINRFKKDKPDPRGSWAQNQVLYSPTLRAPVLTVNTGGDASRYMFDHDKREWKRLGASPEKIRWNEFYATYVPQWNCHLISTAKAGWMKYDVVTGEVSPVEAPADLKACQSLSYDAANNVVIALQVIRQSKSRVVVQPWALDVATGKWTQLDPPQPWPAGQSTGSWAKLWYDPDHNVHLLVNDVKRDREETFDGGVTETWAYRYKAVKK